MPNNPRTRMPGERWRDYIERLGLLEPNQNFLGQFNPDAEAEVHNRLAEEQRRQYEWYEMERQARERQRQVTMPRPPTTTGIWRNTFVESIKGERMGDNWPPEPETSPFQKAVFEITRRFKPNKLGSDQTYAIQTQVNSWVQAKKFGKGEIVDKLLRTADYCLLLAEEIDKVSENEVTNETNV